MKNGKTKKRAAGPNESERRAEIYRLAAQFICDKGFDAMTMNDIATAVKMTKAGVYHYIQGKKDLLYGIMDYGLTLLEERVIVPARASNDPEARLRVLIAAHARLIANGERAIAIVVDEVAGLDPRQRKAINARKRAYFDFLRDTLEELRAQSKLHAVDTTAAAFSLFGMILWLSRWYRASGRLKPEEVADELVKIAFNGVVRSNALPARKGASR